MIEEQIKKVKEKTEAEYVLDFFPQKPNANNFPVFLHDYLKKTQALCLLDYGLSRISSLSDDDKDRLP